MKALIIIIVAICFLSCNKSPMSTTSTQNDNFKVDFLFENDGCKVYRFEDGGRSVYYTNCKGSTTEIHTEARSNGKSSYTVDVRTQTLNDVARLPDVNTK